jgi:pyruvate formate lyase activating enzyme
MYRMQQTPPTPAASIHRAAELGRAAGLRYIYSGNLPGDLGENTFCSHCGRMLIGRRGFTVVTRDLDAGSCPGCGTRLDGIF